MSDNVRDLAAQFRYEIETLVRQLEPREDEAIVHHSHAEKTGDPEAEYLTRLYRDEVQGLLENARSAIDGLSYMLGEIDAEGELYFCPEIGKFRLPGVDDYFEFTCGSSIEVFCTGNCCRYLDGEWHIDRVEHSDKLGYYLYHHGIPLAPGMRARHRRR